VSAIASNIPKIAPAANQHAAPRAEPLLGKRLGEPAKKIDHHFGYALLRGSHSPLVWGKAELLADRRLYARPVQDLAFDF